MFFSLLLLLSAFGWHKAIYVWGSRQSSCSRLNLSCLLQLLYYSHVVCFRRTGFTRKVGFGGLEIGRSNENRQPKEGRQQTSYVCRDVTLKCIWCLHAQIRCLSLNWMITLMTHWTSSNISEEDWLLVTNKYFVQLFFGPSSILDQTTKTRITWGSTWWAVDPNHRDFNSSRSWCFFLIWILLKSYISGINCATRSSL